jgi:hypothetical protein
MLQKIRDRISGWFATVFLSAIAIVFVFWGIKFEGSVSSAAARVNGESVPIDKVRRAWQERQTELQREIRDELPAELVRSEQSALLDDFVRRELLRQRTGELGYRVGDQKLVETLNSIPALQWTAVLARPLSALLRQQGRSEASFEADLARPEINELRAASPSPRSSRPLSSGDAPSSRVAPRRRFRGDPASAFEPAKGPTDAGWGDGRGIALRHAGDRRAPVRDLTLDSVAAEVS